MRLQILGDGSDSSEAGQMGWVIQKNALHNFNQSCIVLHPYELASAAQLLILLLHPRRQLSAEKR